ncbi:hypothetical protein N9B82_05650 [Saprospiraceae bacterium]|nr:hypothetical protein [Saprospiraceae bacterium]
MITLLQKKNFVQFIIPIGILSFICLFLYASSLYPGGSQADLSSVGYDWVNNYWCNLLNEKAMNKQVNPARPYAIFAMATLCVSLISFFINIGRSYSEFKFWSRAIEYGGTLSMITAIFMFTKYHDIITVISSFLGLFAVLGISVIIYKSSFRFYKYTAIFIGFLLFINNFIYYSGSGISYLPLVQKFSMLVVLLWVIGLNQVVIKRSEEL